MFPLVITIHVIACVLLILIVLVQQGRGGGLIDTLSSAESIFGTKTSSFLVKSTSVLAVVFFFTCLGLAFLSIQKSKSLLKGHKIPLTETAQTNAAKNAAQKPQQQGAVQSVPQPAAAQSAPVAPAPEKVADINKQTVSETVKTPNPVATTPQPSQTQQPLEKIQN